MALNYGSRQPACGKSDTFESTRTKNTRLRLRAGKTEPLKPIFASIGDGWKGLTSSLQLGDSNPWKSIVLSGRTELLIFCVSQLWICDRSCLAQLSGGEPELSEGITGHALQHRHATFEAKNERATKETQRIPSGGSKQNTKLSEAPFGGTCFATCLEPAGSNPPITMWIYSA